MDLGGHVNVLDAVDSVTVIDVVKIREFAVGICPVDVIGGVPKILALV